LLVTRPILPQRDDAGWLVEPGRAGRAGGTTTTEISHVGAMSAKAEIAFHWIHQLDAFKENIMRTNHTRPWLALGVASLALTGLAACGSDSSKKVSKAACDAMVEFGNVYAQAPQDPAEFKTFAADQLVPLGHTLVDVFSGSAKDAAKTLHNQFDQIAENGDPSILDSEAGSKARATLGKAVHDGCDLTPVNIKAVEYAFVDAPFTLKAGRVSFALENTGVEDHEMVLFKRADGATESLDDILQLPEEEMMSKVMFTGVTFGGPKTTNYVSLDLTPGTYFLLCFLPQGGGQDGPPHFMAGMKQTIEVA
jgi:hypothetical protein